MTGKTIADYKLSVPVLLNLVLPLAFFYAIYAELIIIIGIIICYYLFVLTVHLYVKYVSNGVYLENVKKSIYLFPGEGTEISIPVVNASPFPLVHAKYSFRIDPSIDVNSKEIELDKQQGNLYSGFFIQQPKCTNEYVLSLSVNQRGVYRLERVNLLVEDIFRVVRMSFPSLPSLATEMIVYPLPKKVHNIHLLQQDVYGVEATNRSVYYDESAVVGTKNYERESFRHIHWKATARLQQLQAKQFQPIHNRRLCILLCLTSTERKLMRQDGEDLISYVAFLCEYLTKQKLTYEVFISIDKKGKPFHIPMGEGNAHFANVLEALARIKNNFSLLATKPFLSECQEQGEQYSTYIILGAEEEECRMWKGHYYRVDVAGQLKRGGAR